MKIVTFALLITVFAIMICTSNNSSFSNYEKIMLALLITFFYAILIIVVFAILYSKY